MFEIEAHYHDRKIYLSDGRTYPLGEILLRYFSMNSTALEDLYDAFIGGTSAEDIADIIEFCPSALGVELHLPRLTAMRHIAAVYDGIDFLLLEISQRSRKILIRPMRTMPVALDGSSQVRIADDAKDEVRLAFRLPSGRRRKEPPTAKPERRRSAKEISPCHGHRHSLIPS